MQLRLVMTFLRQVDVNIQSKQCPSTKGLSPRLEIVASNLSHMCRWSITVSIAYNVPKIAFKTKWGMSPGAGNLQTSSGMQAGFILGNFTLVLE